MKEKMLTHEKLSELKSVDDLFIEYHKKSYGDSPSGNHNLTASRSAFFAGFNCIKSELAIYQAAARVDRNVYDQCLETINLKDDKILSLLSMIEAQGEMIDEAECARDYLIKCYDHEKGASLGLISCNLCGELVHYEQQVFHTCTPTPPKTVDQMAQKYTEDAEESKKDIECKRTAPLKTLIP
jgi:hypothetical protein